MDWGRYDQQEDDEPFDALLKAKGSVGQAGLGRYKQEEKVQSYLRMIKMKAGTAKSTLEWLHNFTRQNPAPGAAYCRARLDGEISPLLRWHYCLALYFAEGGDWLARAIPLILGSAERTGDSLRSSSYLLLAHNLNRWHNCKKGAAVLDLALRLVRERGGERHGHWYAAVVADLEKWPGVKDEVRDLMLAAAGEAGPDTAYLYLEAAIDAAGDKAPAKAAWVEFHERYADATKDPPLKIARYNDAKRHAGGREEMRRINEKIKDAQKAVVLGEFKHTYEVPREEVRGGNGLERVQYLVRRLRIRIPRVEAARMQEEEMRKKFPLRCLSTRIKVADDGVPGPMPHASREEDRADHTEQISNAIRILTAYFSASVRECEEDDRITGDSYAGYLESFGLLTRAGMRLARAGIKAHCSGNYVESIHVLLPQLEQTLRLLLEQRGARMLAGRDKVSTALLKPMIKEGRDVLGEDVAEFLRVWLVDEGSINLRNRVCHALYGDYTDMDGYDPLHEFNHGTSLLLILAVCLLASMSVEAAPGGVAPLHGNGGAPQ